MNSVAVLLLEKESVGGQEVALGRAEAGGEAKVFECRRVVLLVELDRSPRRVG